MIILKGTNLSRVFQIAQQEQVALSPVSVNVYRGELLIVTGPSGSGKSTLLNILGGLDRPTTGEVLYRDQSLKALDEPALARLRNITFGFVLQSPHMLPDRTVLENVMLPFQYGSVMPGADQYRRADELLEYVGLAELAERYPNTLSVGELQRVVFARALVRDPEIILADEPTGSLDADNSGRLLALLEDQARRGRTIILVTHDEKAMTIGARHLQIDKYH
ncbi:ABC transporter ATP-binding protein [Pseudomonadota bacterium]